MSDVNAGPRKRTGRPPKDGNQKRVPLSARINPEMRNALEVAAKEENRSLTQLSEMALAAFLEARKLGHGNKEVSPTASLPSAEKLPLRPASLERSLKHRRQPVDVFGRAFGRDVTALMLAIGCLVKDIAYYSEHKKPETLLADPQTFSRMTDAIVTLLRLIGPEDHPALIESVREALWGGMPETAPSGHLEAGIVAQGIAFADSASADCIEPLAEPVIRDWLGEAVPRIRQRLVSEEPAPSSTAGQSR